ncbi:MAG: hypothetical protein E7454_00795 [Ruminococcaceae bacterium]|nr:hypothetical protein [Oscillospiraceae bacterium]
MNDMEKRPSAFASAIDVTVQNLLQMKEKTQVAGNIIEAEGMKIIPISKVSIGFAGGAADILDQKKGKKKSPSGSGAGITETPVAFLVISQSGVKVMSVEQKEKDESEFLSSLIAEAKKLFAGKKENKK